MKHILLTAALAAPLAFSSARAQDGLGTSLAEHRASDIFSQCAIALSHNTGSTVEFTRMDVQAACGNLERYCRIKGGRLACK